MIKATFVHVSVVAEDWKRLVAFYCDVFGCEVVPPTRDLSGPKLEAGIGVPGARIRGVHLRLPGWGETGPTLEVFQYDSPGERGRSSPRGAAPDINAPGWAHLAFRVEDVAKAHDAVLRHGGSAVGEIVSMDVEGAGRVTFAYMRDPEGNVVELQSWRE